MTSQDPQRVGVWVVAASIGGTVLLGAGAFWLSFTALADLAHRAGTPAELAWVWPLIVDGIIVIATMSVVALSPYGTRATRYPWMLLGGAALVSVAANIIHALVVTDDSVPGVLAALVASVPPIVLLAVTHLTVELGRYRREQQQPTLPHPASATTQSVVEPLSTASHASGEAPPSLLRGTRESGMPVLASNELAEPDSLRSPVDRLILRQQADTLSQDGLSNRQIADKLGVHATTVGRWLTHTPNTRKERNAN